MLSQIQQNVRLQKWDKGFCKIYGFSKMQHPKDLLWKCLSLLNRKGY